MSSHALNRPGSGYTHRHGSVPRLRKLIVRSYSQTETVVVVPMTFDCDWYKIRNAKYRRTLMGDPRQVAVWLLLLMHLRSVYNPASVVSLFILLLGWVWAILGVTVVTTGYTAYYTTVLSYRPGYWHVDSTWPRLMTIAYRAASTSNGHLRIHPVMRYIRAA